MGTSEGRPSCLVQVVKGSPFCVSIVPDIAEPAQCVATIVGMGIGERHVEAGEEVSVITELRDCFGNVTTIAGEGLRLTTDMLDCVNESRKRGLSHLYIVNHLPFKS